MAASPLGKSDETQRHLRRCVFRAIEHLEANLAQPPSVDELATTAGLSKFHFQRAFKSVIGETLNQHSRRLRVERAASLLKNSSWQVGDVAIACGYKTQANFTRDFTKFYGNSPQNYRTQNRGTPFLRGHFRKRPEKELADPHLPIPTVTMSDWPELHPICLRFYGPPTQIPSAWTELISWARNAIPNLEQARFLGIWFDEWTSPDPDNASYRYECALIPAQPLSSPPPAPFYVRPLTGGTVASTISHGDVTQLDQEWRNFGLGWFPYSGFQPRMTEISGIDEYPAEVVLAPLPKQALMILKGITLRMHIPVQRQPVAF